MYNQNEKVEKVNVAEEMSKSFLDYSMSVIISRALPDARDGLKPSQRRILFAMSELAIVSSRRPRLAAGDWAAYGRAMTEFAELIKGEGLQHFVNRAVRQQPIEKLKLQFGAVATDLKSGQPILFRRGNTGAAVRASSAVPGVFQPVRVGNIDYVDGGLVSPVPVSFARKMGADFVIAVNISAQPDAQPASSTFEVLLQTFAIMGRSINHWELQNADLLIRPSLVGVSSSDFTARMKAVQSGREAATAQWPALKAKIAALTR